MTRTYASGCLGRRSEEHTSELQSQSNLVCRLLLEKKKQQDPPPENPLMALPTLPASLGYVFSTSPPIPVNPEFLLACMVDAAGEEHTALVACILQCYIRNKTAQFN